MAKNIKNSKQERTVVLIKPDGVKRGLIGEIISRIEKRGLKIIAISMIKPTREQINEHYPKDPSWIGRLGEKSLATYAKYGWDPKRNGHQRSYENRLVGARLGFGFYDFGPNGEDIGGRNPRG